MMNELDPNVLLTIFISVLCLIIGFFFKREREIATIQATLKAAHKRLDRIEKIQNGVTEDKNERMVD